MKNKLAVRRRSIWICPVIMLLLSSVLIQAAEEKAGRPGKVRNLESVLLADSPESRNATPPPLPSDYKLLYKQDFSDPKALQDFVMTDPNAWQLTPAAGQETKSALALVKQSKYKPAVRSPVNIAMIADRVFADFILEVEMKQTGREYGHRDMCLFFGMQDPSHFYYTHMATKADPNAHNIFIVNEAPRKNIAKKTTEGARWGLEEWHRVRLVRTASDGMIKVYFDDMKNPIMMAEDSHFKSGYVGFGSFDDTGKVTGIKIWGPSVQAQKAEFYTRPK